MLRASNQSRNGEAIERQVMYAVIKTGGKQYRVTPGTCFNVEKLAKTEAPTPGSVVSCGDVLLVHDGSEVKIGQPLVRGAKVELEVLGPMKGPKIVSYKKIRRKGKRWKKGHRQSYTRVRVQEIVTG